MNDNIEKIQHEKLSKDEALRLVCMLMEQAREESQWSDALQLIRQAFEMVRLHLPELSELASSKNTDAVEIARQGFQSEAITQILGAMEGVKLLPAQRKSLFRAMIAACRGLHTEAIKQISEAMLDGEFEHEQRVCLFWAIEALDFAMQSEAILDETYNIEERALVVQAQIDDETSLMERAAARAAELNSILPSSVALAEIVTHDDGTEDAEAVDESEAVRVILTEQGEMLPSFVTESGEEVPLVDYLAERDIFAKMVEEGDETKVFPAAFVDLLAKQEEQPEVDAAFDMLLKPKDEPTPDATSDEPLEVEEVEMIAPAPAAARSVPPPPPSRKSCASLPPPLPVHTSTEEAQFFEEGERITRRSSPKLLAIF